MLRDGAPPTLTHLTSSYKCKGNNMKMHPPPEQALKGPGDFAYSLFSLSASGEAEFRAVSIRHHARLQETYSRTSIGDTELLFFE